jgi:CRP/FNR family transcriptional regulator, cyclic AMP receptor protein
MIAIDLFRKEDKFETFAAGQTIFKEGDLGHAMYVVLDGSVSLLVKGQLVEILMQGGVFGEMALIDATPRSATAVADSECRLVAINEKRFSFLIQQTPKFAIQIMRVMAERLRNMDKRL